MALTLCLVTQAQDWKSRMSRVEEHVVKSEVLGTERNYTVYLPAGYDIDKEKHYPVLHMGAEGVDAQKVAQGDKTALLMEAAHRLSCVDYVKNADEARKQELRTVKWFVDCGDDDFLFDGNIDFYQAMRRAQIPCQLRVRDGGHTWEYWHSALYIALPWVSRAWKD